MGSQPRKRSQLRQLVKALRAIQEIKSALTLPPLDAASLHLRGCKDGSRKAVDQSISAGRCLVFLADQ